MMTATKRFEFDYAHKLPNYDGNCANLHGHRGVLELTVNKAPNHLRKEGMIIDFKDLKAIVQPVVDKLDHAYLNDIIKNPTAENICRWFYNELFETDLRYCLVRIRVYETSDSFIDLFI